MMRLRASAGPAARVRHGIFADVSMLFCGSPKCRLHDSSSLVFTASRTLRQAAHFFICITRNAEQRYRSE